MAKRTLILSLVLVLALPLAASAFTKLGDTVEPFTIKMDDGTDFDAAKLIGKEPFVLNFMNTVCSTCMTELADMRGFIKAYPGIKFFPVAVDMRGAEALKGLKTAEVTNYNYLIDSSFTLARKFGISSTPATIIVDKTGKVVGFNVGYDENAKAAIESKLSSIK